MLLFLVEGQVAHCKRGCLRTSSEEAAFRRPVFDLRSSSVQHRRMSGCSSGEAVGSFGFGCIEAVVFGSWGCTELVHGRRVLFQPSQCRRKVGGHAYGGA